VARHKRAILIKLEQDVPFSTVQHISKWVTYRDSRRGTYKFRARTRYKAVADLLFSLGLANYHSVLDLGAGSCQFGRYLRRLGFHGAYLPVDAVLDGTDLETFNVPTANFVIAIEVLEHLRAPLRLLSSMEKAAERAVVITTPNSETVNVIRCDPTHVSVVHAHELENNRFTVQRESWFGVPDDSLLAWKPARFQRN